QLDRYHSTYYRYHESALGLVLSVKARGKNSWVPVMQKSDIVNSSSGDMRNYYKSLTDGFDIGTPVSMYDLIQVVSAKRSRYGLPPFTNNILSQCLNEFEKVFVYEEDTYNIDGEE